MDETAEVPQKEKVVISPELQSSMTEATSAIEADMASPVSEIATPTRQMGMFAELGQLAKDHTVKRLGIMFKDVKAALGVVPFVDRISKWNTARIANNPAFDAIKAKKFDPDSKQLIDSTFSVRQVAQDEITRRERTAVSAVNKAAYASEEAHRADKAMLEAKDTMLKAHNKLEKARDKMKHVKPKSEQFAAAQDEYKKSVQTLRIAQEKYGSLQKTALDRLASMPEPKDIKRFSKEWFASKKGEALKRLTHTHSDEEFLQKYKRVEEKFREERVRNKKFTYNESDILRSVANGDIPAVGGWEKAGRFAKQSVKLHILQSLGPIIDPIPDVPPLVATASHIAETFGGQWYAGLVPPVWQLLHNKYAEFRLGFNTSKKAMEIVNRHWNQRVDRLLEKKIEKSAGIFLKPAETQGDAV